MSPDLASQETRRIVFESGELPPALPVLRLQPALNAHGGHVTIGAAERAIARGRERVRKPRLGDEAGGGAQDGSRDYSVADFDSTSLHTSSTNCSRGFTPISACLRWRTDTVPASASRSPTTSTVSYTHLRAHET